MSKSKVRKIAEQMLRDEVNGRSVLDGDDWDSKNRFEVGDRLFLRCAFYKPDSVGDYVWVIQDQTNQKLDITGAPDPHEGGNAVVECDAVSQDPDDDEKLVLGNAKIIEFQLNDRTVEELADRL